MIVRISCFLVGVTFLAGLCGSSMPIELSSTEMNTVFGGADCWIEGSQACPAVKKFCKTTKCEGDFDILAPDYGMTCPSGTKAEKAHPDYKNATISTDKQGREGFKKLEAIDCHMDIDCEHCSYNASGVWCKNGDVLIGTDGRVPTDPDEKKPECNKPKS